MTALSNNLKAFLTMIAESEGTQRLGHNNGYDVLVGGTLFKGKEHPMTITETCLNCLISAQNHRIR